MATQNKVWYPKADPNEQPSTWWYYGRALYVSRLDYRKIFFTFLAFGIPTALMGVLFHLPAFWYSALAMAGLGVLLLMYSLFGLYRQYGPPAQNYFARLLKQADVKGDATIADIHIGTYRHSYQIANLLPEATIYSVDCWEEADEPELAIADVRSLEPSPTHLPKLKSLKAHDFEIPLETASCDAIVFGFGTHEIPKGRERDKIFAEAMRILKPGGKALMFEHGIDFHNYLIFGPVIHHVTTHNEWMDTMKTLVHHVKEDRMYAVNMITGVKA
ncbi:MAG TPA: methyltransferase domain-containing protein [Abditibacteriaceae bacterium]|jgi:ubiquinone/menaquinone biosynthesis C-methylase UbiE